MRRWTPLLVSAVLGGCAELGVDAAPARRQVSSASTTDRTGHALAPPRVRAATHRALAAAYLSEGRADIALAEAEAALAVVAHDPFAMHIAALSAAALGRNDQALAHFETLYRPADGRAPADQDDFAATDGQIAASNFARFLCGLPEGDRRRGAAALLAGWTGQGGPREAIERILEGCTGAAGSRRTPAMRGGRGAGTPATGTVSHRAASLAAADPSPNRRQAKTRGRISTHCQALQDTQDTQDTQDKG